MDRGGGRGDGGGEEGPVKERRRGGGGQEGKGDGIMFRGGSGYGNWRELGLNLDGGSKQGYFWERVVEGYCGRVGGGGGEPGPLGVEWTIPWGPQGVGWFGWRDGGYLPVRSCREAVVFVGGVGWGQRGHWVLVWEEERVHSNIFQSNVVRAEFSKRRGAPGIFREASALKMEKDLTFSMTQSGEGGFRCSIMLLESWL